MAVAHILPTNRNEVTEGQSFWLDVVRGMAAMLVLLAHTRAHFFAGWSEGLPGVPKLILAPFYILTGMGHEAVVLFFVMSGLLVGRRFKPDIDAATVNMRKYTIDRLTRIWIVLIPAVIFSVIAAYILIAIYGYSYSGTTDRCQPRIGDILGTLLFLNEGYLPTICSNGPAWSIHSEMHYYLLWPLTVFAVSPSTKGRTRILSGTLLVTVIVCLLLFDSFDEKNTLILAPIWIAGAFLNRVPTLRLPLWVLGGILVATMAAPSFGAWKGLWPLSDCAIGIAALLFFARARAATLCPKSAKRVAAWLAGISFSLYLTHIIIVTGIRTVLEYGEGWRFPITNLTPQAWLLYVGTVGMAVAFAQLFWGCSRRIRRRRGVSFLETESVANAVTSRRNMPICRQVLACTKGLENHNRNHALASRPGAGPRNSLPARNGLS
ncbi:acyltransferase family protein [Altericroceibacterium spongiae]|nr:acyltransferase [Altericroceibacterium spongiae]